MGRILVKEGGKRNRDESTGIRNNRLKTRSSQLPSQPHRHAYSIHGFGDHRGGFEGEVGNKEWLSAVGIMHILKTGNCDRSLAPLRHVGGGHVERWRGSAPFLNEMLHNWTVYVSLVTRLSMTMKL
ncbi:hypothetical protein SCLCIDRAFT_916854 [Scleroderma citrinum Foug A]|uniref:Uncharacterized protein n=1 Tax=Scleroderma citrinum Foug A TaxID=1036808 RepID=A0A0C3DXT0_9AGAM|nr:hypothetical protein SCLCIDRAFT_916854 [Scleroderma citrinum Foug A]